MVCTSRFTRLRLSGFRWKQWTEVDKKGPKDPSVPKTPTAEKHGVLLHPYRFHKTIFPPANWMEKLLQGRLGSLGVVRRKFPEGGLDFLEVALVWTYPHGILPKQTSTPKLQTSPSRSGSMQKLVVALSYESETPILVVPNAVGHRNTQMRANVRKWAQKSANARPQKSAKQRKRAQTSSKERFHVKIANNQVWNNQSRARKPWSANCELKFHTGISEVKSA